MSVSLLLVLLPILFVNIWHGYVLLATKTSRPETISEHAAQNEKWLLIHRIVHITASVLLILYAGTFLSPEGHILLALILIIGALFDIVEVLTLRKDLPTGPQALKEPHTLTAWGMGVSYMIFSVMLVSVSSLQSWVTHAVWLVFVGMLAISILLKFRWFWAFQMCYFLALSGVILLAHINLS